MMSERWLFCLSFNACSVSPTYCRPHLLHWIKYTTSLDLQVAAVRRVYVFPVQWLLNVSVVMRAEQVLQHDHPHGVLPGGWVVRGARSARTNRSQSFLFDGTQQWEAGGRLVWSSLTSGGCDGAVE